MSGHNDNKRNSSDNDQKKDPFISFLLLILSLAIFTKGALGLYHNEVQTDAFTFARGMPILHDADAFFYCLTLFACSFLVFPYAIPGLSDQEKVARQCLYLALIAFLLHLTYKWWMR